MIRIMCWCQCSLQGILPLPFSGFQCTLASAPGINDDAGNGDDKDDGDDNNEDVIHYVSGRSGRGRDSKLSCKHNQVLQIILYCCKISTTINPCVRIFQHICSAVSQIIVKLCKIVDRTNLSANTKPAYFFTRKSLLYFEFLICC